MSLRVFLAFALLLVGVAGVSGALTDNITFSYSFDNNATSGTTAIDSAGVRNATLVNSVTTGATGKIGQAYTFGSTKYVVANSNPYSANIEQMTITAWVKPSSLPASLMDLISTEDISPGNGFTLRYNGFDDKLVFFRHTGGSASASTESSINPLTAGTWSFLVVTFDNGNATIYVDDVQVGSSTSGTYIEYGTANPPVIGNFGDTGAAPFPRPWLGEIDEVTVWNKTLSRSELTTLYNSGDGLAYPFSTPSGSTFVSLTAVDAYDGSSITTFNASLTNTSGTYDFSTTNGTINTNIDATTGPYNITFSVANYFSNTTADVDVSSGSVQGSLAQAYVSFLCFEKHTNTSLTCAQPGPLPRQADSYTDQVNVTGYHPVNYFYTLSALDNETFSVYGFYDHELTVTAEDYLGASLSNFTLWVNSSLVNYTVTDNNTGSVELGLLQGYNYTIEITENIPSGAQRNNSIESAVFVVPADPSTSSESYQFNLTFPSLTITVLDEDTGVNAPGNTTVTFTASNSSFSKTIVNGTGVFNASDSIPSGSYSVRFENDDYADRVYNLTYNREFPQSLTAYLVNTSSPNVVFVLEDRDTRNVVEGATITVQRFINGTLTTVNVLESDITGRTAFDYLANQEYRFQITHPDYTSKNFTLNPILFPSYTLLMDSPSTAGETTGDYAGIGYVFNTARFVEGRASDLSATVSDASGGLVSYGFNITVNGVLVDTQTGSNAYGSVITSNAIIPETPYNGTAVIDYYYQLSDGNHYKFRFIYAVEQVNAYSNQTWVGNKDIAADIPILDRVVVVTIILAAVGALAFTFGGLTTAAIGMMLIMGFFSFTGFINPWVFAVPIIGLFFLLVGREAQ